MHRVTRRRDHNAHFNEEEKDYDNCFPITVHCESEEEMKEIAEHISKKFGDSNEE